MYTSNLRASGSVADVQRTSGVTLRSTVLQQHVPSTSNPSAVSSSLSRGLVREYAARKSVIVASAAPAAEAVSSNGIGATHESKPMKIVIAGAGIGGLVLAVGLLKKGFAVQILERDLTAIRGEGKYRGPIQIQSNALAALEALDTDVAERVLAEGCKTGDRVNGLCDGVTGDWYVKFDTFHPAVDRGLPVTRVISRQLLQEILADKVLELGGENVILNDIHVVDYKEEKDANGATKIHAITESGQVFVGDLLVGADGIHSKVRKKLVGPGEPYYSEYTCYTGISDFTPPDIDTVGYRVFLGNKQYFVSSDVGGGKMQWYAFHKEPAGGDDEPGTRKQRLLEIFGHWSDMVTDLIRCTPEDDVLRRDIYDRAPIFKWFQGRVVLLGDSAHAMQPNLGQGGCMAIEDAFQLAQDLDDAVVDAAKNKTDVNVGNLLFGYQTKRVFRAAAIHGMARMAAIMASTYKAYLGEGLGPLESMTKLKIPHPGRVGGQLVMKLTMPGVLQWVLAGNENKLSDARASSCRISDQPAGFSESDFPLFMRDDDALLRAANAAWSVLPESSAKVGSEDGAVMIVDGGVTIGTAPGSQVVLDAATSGASTSHARVHFETNGDYFVTDLGSENSTWVNDRRISNGFATQVRPGDRLRFGKEVADGSNEFRIKLKHVSLLDGAEHGQYQRRSGQQDLIGAV